MAVSPATGRLVVVWGREAADAQVDTMWAWGDDAPEGPGTGRPGHERLSWLTGPRHADLHLVDRERTIRR